MEVARGPSRRGTSVGYIRTDDGVGRALIEAAAAASAASAAETAPASGERPPIPSSASAPHGRTHLDCGVRTLYSGTRAGWTKSGCGGLRDVRRGDVGSRARWTVANAQQARGRGKKRVFPIARDSTTFSGARELIGEMTVQKRPYIANRAADRRRRLGLGRKSERPPVRATVRWGSHRAGSERTDRPASEASHPTRQVTRNPDRGSRRGTLAVRRHARAVGVCAVAKGSSTCTAA